MLKKKKYLTPWSRLCQITKMKKDKKPVFQWSWCECSKLDQITISKLQRS